MNKMFPNQKPVVNETGKISIFEKLKKEADPYLEMNDVEFDFSALDDLFLRFQRLSQSDANAAWNLAQEILAWRDYISSLLALCTRTLKDAETDKISILAQASVRYDEKKVSNGDRLANLDESVVAARKKRNVLEAFHEMLEAKKETCDMMHYFCKSTVNGIQMHDAANS